jgi:hypothetical protein
MEIEWRIVPIKFHNRALLYVHRPCNVLTMYLHGNGPLCQQENQTFFNQKKWLPEKQLFSVSGASRAGFQALRVRSASYHLLQVCAGDRKLPKTAGMAAPRRYEVPEGPAAGAFKILACSLLGGFGPFVGVVFTDSVHEIDERQE